MNLIFYITFLCFSSFLLGKSVPTLTRPVMDEARVLSDIEVQKLEQEIHKIYNKAHGPAQLQVLIIKSLEGDSIEEYGIKVTDDWKLGQKNKDNGLLILVSIKDRTLRLEVGRGLEGDVPDIIAGRIIDQMKPFLREQKYFDAILYGIQKIDARLNGERGIENTSQDEKSDDSIPILLILLTDITQPLQVLLNLT